MCGVGPAKTAAPSMADLPLMPALLFLCIGWLQAPAARAQTELELWRDVQLPEGMQLDLARGILAGPGEALLEGYLVLDDGMLSANPPLRALARPAPLPPSWNVRRDEGVAGPRHEARANAEFVFDLGGDLWGYLRVLDGEDDVVRLEIAYGPSSGTLVERDPIDVLTESMPEGLALRWHASESSPANAKYLVWRTIVGQAAEGEPAYAAELVAEVRGREWIDPAPPRRLLEYRVAREGASPARAAGLGARARAIRVERPGEWPIELEAGMRIDLLTGELGGERAHLEILRLGAQRFQLRPLERTRLSLVSGPGDPSWVVPEAYAPEIRNVLLGGELVARLAEGVYVRLQFLGDGQANAHLVRQLDPWGGRVLPRAPELPQASWADGRVRLTFAPLEPAVVEAEFAVRVVEREKSYGTDDWEEVLLGSALESQAEIVESSRGVLARYRYRHRLPSGIASLPSAPQRVLLGDVADPATVEALLDRAFAGLLDADWRRRCESRDGIELLSDRASERLVAALRSSDPAMQSAAREILVETSKGHAGTHVRVILEARAALEGVLAPAPEGWLAAEVIERERALLDALHPPVEEVRRAWTRVLALSDPDPGVRAFAELLLQRPFPEDRDGVPWAVLPAEVRARSTATGLGTLFARGGDGRQLARSLVLAADLDRPRAALVTLEIAARLASQPWPSLEPELGRSDAQLALELVDRYRAGGGSALLAAAEELVVTPRARLEALEQLMRARFEQVPSASVAQDLGREQIELAAPDFDLLSGMLDARGTKTEKALDLVLPAGEYRPIAGRTNQTLEIHSSGVRLLGRGGPARIFATLRIHHASDVVLEHISIEPDQGLALSVVDASVTLRDCSLSRAGTSISLQDGQLELDRVHLLPPSDEGEGSHSAQITGASLFFARRSLLENGGIRAIGKECFVYLERCVLDGRDQNAIQMQDSGLVVVRDLLLRGRGPLIAGKGEMLLEGAVLAGESLPMQSTDGRVSFCPDHLSFAGERAELLGATGLDICPLAEQR